MSRVVCHRVSKYQQMPNVTKLFIGNRFFFSFRIQPSAVDSSFLPIKMNADDISYSNHVRRIALFYSNTLSCYYLSSLCDTLLYANGEGTRRYIEEKCFLMSIESEGKEEEKGKSQIWWFRSSVAKTCLFLSSQK